jgi:putative membrane protein
MMRNWGTGVHWWAWVLGTATTAVFWALVIWAIVALVRPRGAGGPGDGDDAAQAVARRPAAGEIDRGEHRRGAEARRSRPYASAGWP